MSNSLLHSHYSSGGIPSEIAENLKDLFPEDGDLSYEEVLLQQETVYLSFQANGKNKNMSSEYGQTSNGHQLSAQKSDSSQSPESQLALDEAIARSLQLGDDFEDYCRDELNSTVAGIRESPPRESPPVENPNTRRQDDIDPDSMTYEVIYTDKSCSSIFCHHVSFLIFHFDCLLSFLVGIAVFRRNCWPAEQRAFTRPLKSFTNFQIQDWILLKEKENGRVCYMLCCIQKRRYVDHFALCTHVSFRMY
ncbi:E3 ubiquitin-protein ligase BIG BROTHER-like isoform X2 [Solanum verrucosum]|uniref:E3 ubiquitin-protein ligase BIG BROTHER-like isoform X2 n=1 Tax=Solanum verrucosum TaxID=315347 RepID=UPI0020D1C757|nr:E3 ubiquitin-protein ligase BIG BROTHER-like isoform X2 [Solanum verrucosum]